MSAWWNRLRARFRRSFGLLPPAELAALGGEDDEPQYRSIDRKLLMRMLAALRPYWRRYTLGISLGLVMVSLETMSPLFMRAIIDTALERPAAVAASDEATERRSDGGEDRASALPPPPSSLRRSVAPSLSPDQQILTIVAIWASALATVLLLQRATILIMVHAGERVQFDFRKALFAQLQRLSMSYYDRTKLGRIISRCTSDITGMRDVNVWGIDTVVKNLLMMLVAGGMLLATEPRLFLSVAWLGVVLYLVNRFFRKRLSVVWQVAREGYTRVATNLAENISGVRVVTAFNRQTFNLSVFNRLQQANTLNNVRAARLNGIYQPTLQVIGFCGRATILLYGGYLVSTGQIASVGAVVAAFLYWDMFMSPILTFGNFHNQLMLAMAGAERVFNLLDLQPEVQDAPDARPLARIEGRVSFENVTFGYNPDQPVLHGVSFDAAPGQTVALVGATGSGKSTIISLIARFYQPQAGRVLVDGRDLRHVTGESLHRQMGLVLQNNFLFTGSVLDNIRYAKPDASEDEVVAAARAIGSYDAIASLAQGFQTPVGERGANMSLGQRQLICFTRAFLTDPRIFLLDEATSAVDSVTELTVQRSLERLRANRTTFIVAHRLSTITRADCILFIEAGRIVERGRHEELLAAGGKYAALYRQFVSDGH